MFADQQFDLAKLLIRKSTAASKTDGRQPELGDLIVPLHVDVRRLAAITRIEENSIRANPKDCRHVRTPFAISIMFPTLPELVSIINSQQPPSPPH